MKPATFRSSSTTRTFMAANLPGGRCTPVPESRKISSRLGFDHGEREDEPTATGVGFRHQVAAQEPRQPAGEGDAEAVALALFAGGGEVDVEDPLGDVGVDAGAGVVDLEDDRLAVRLHSAHDRGGGRRVPNRVAEQILVNLLRSE